MAPHPFACRGPPPSRGPLLSHTTGSRFNSHSRLSVSTHVRVLSIFMSPPIRKQVVSALADPAFPRPTAIRLSKRSSPFPLGPRPLSLLPPCTNSHHQLTQVRAYRNTHRLTRTKSVVETATRSMVNRPTGRLRTLPKVGDCWRGVLSLLLYSRYVVLHLPVLALTLYPGISPASCLFLSRVVCYPTLWGMVVDLFP